MPRAFYFDDRPAKTPVGKKPTRRGNRGDVKGRGAWQYRVCFRRQSWRPKVKKFGTEAAALKFYKILTSPTPWKHYGKYGSEPDEEHYKCNGDTRCLCQTGTPVYGEKLGTIAHYIRRLRATIPPLEYCYMEARWMQPWQSYTPAWTPEPEPEQQPITDPRRLLPPRPRFDRDDEPWLPKPFDPSNPDEWPDGYEGGFDIPF